MTGELIGGALVGAEEINQMMTATYSPEDNKLRLSASSSSKGAFPAPHGHIPTPSRGVPDFAKIGRKVDS
jgi:hypothetical protein